MQANHNATSATATYPKTMKISVSHLGLAAYIKMQGCKLLGTMNKQFQFDSPKTVGDWRVEYANSESSRHDALVCELREHLRSPVQAA